VIFCNLNSGTITAAVSLVRVFIIYEYAELEWPIDIAIALIWVVFGINMIGTILKEENVIYMLQYGFIGHVCYCSGLHIFNSLSPVSPMKSYVYAVQDALVQWW
jgi:cytochrome c oxidase cbb3-type subunit I/II